MPHPLPSPQSADLDSPRLRYEDGSIARFLQNPPRSRTVAIACVATAVGLIGVVDYFTGPRLLMILFYLMPVALGTAWLGGRGGFCVALFCSTTHAVADWIGSDQPYTLVTLWNRLLVFAIYMVVARSVAELMALQRHLEDRVLERTGELKKALAAQTELQNRIGAASRYERSTIGRELHDGLCQHLAATNIAADMLANKLDASQSGAGDDARQISTMLVGAIGQTRQIARGLLLASIKPGELDAELQELCRTASRKCKTACAYTRVGALPQINDAQASHLFFIAQEALRNALRHSGATHIDIELRGSGAGDSAALDLAISDNGRGLDVAASRHSAPEGEGKYSGLGMLIMRHRAELIGGRLDIDSLANGQHGTRIYCRLPGPFAQTSSSPL